MLQFLLAVHFLLTVAIIGLILLQKHDSDGALGSSGGGSASGMLFSVRGQANLLTRSTAILMTIFLINCLSMAKLTKKTPTQGSLIDAVAAQTAQAEKENAAAPVSKDTNTNTEAKKAANSVNSSDGGDIATKQTSQDHHLEKSTETAPAASNTSVNGSISANESVPPAASNSAAPANTDTAPTNQKPAPAEEVPDDAD